MALHNSHLRAWFQLGQPPNWQCARCAGGPLQFDPAQFMFRDKAATRAGRGELWFEPEMIEERFAGFARCPNPACGDWVLVSGITRNEVQPDPEEYEEIVVRSLWPTRVVPAPNIIDIPDGCPAAVAEATRRAFDLYWVDTSGAANAIRTAVEALLRHYRIKKYGRDRKTNARVPIPLHNRIDTGFRRRFPEVADTLLAIKWIGNEGSHSEVNLSDDALVDAYDLLDHALHGLFVSPERARHVHRVTKAIISAKSPRKSARGKRASGVVPRSL